MVRSYLHPWSNAQSDRWWSALGSWNNPHRMSSPTSLRSCRGGRKEGERKKDHPGCNSPNHRKTKQTANLQQQEMKLLPFAWPSPSHPRPASHTAAVSNEWGSPLSLLPSRQPSWQHFAVVKSWCCSPDLGARRLIRSLLPAHFTQKAAEPTAAHHIDRGCHQSSCFGAQTHHTPKVIHISIFLSKQKGSWGASFNLFNLMEGKGATSIGRLDAFLTPVTAYCKYTGEKDTSANKNICKIPCLSAGCPQLHQSSRCCINPCFSQLLRGGEFEAWVPRGCQPQDCQTHQIQCSRRMEWGTQQGPSGSQHDSSAPQRWDTCSLLLLTWQCCSLWGMEEGEYSGTLKAWRGEEAAPVWGWGHSCRRSWPCGCPSWELEKRRRKHTVIKASLHPASLPAQHNHSPSSLELLQSRLLTYLRLQWLYKDQMTYSSAALLSLKLLLIALPLHHLPLQAGSVTNLNELWASRLSLLQERRGTEPAE